MSKRFDDLTERARAAGAEAYDHAGEQLKSTTGWAWWRRLEPMQRRAMAVACLLLIGVVGSCALS